MNAYAERVLLRAEGLMERHGGKMVFFGRIVAVLRYTVAWIAGLVRMTWWRFLFWNAAGGIVWATSVGLFSYYAGQAAADAIQRYGLYAAALIIAVVVIGWLAVHFAEGDSRIDSDLSFASFSSDPKHRASTPIPPRPRSPREVSRPPDSPAPQTGIPSGVKRNGDAPAARANR